MVSDLVCFLDYFLKGEPTPQFVLKCATVLAICGSIFWYYLGFLQGRVRSGAFAVAALAAACTACCFGVALSGTPAVQRRIEADNRRVQDLRAIAGVLNGMRELPPTLAAAAAMRPALRLTDPETGRPYEYTLRAAKEFELCAAFSAVTDREGPQWGSGFWAHPKGRACFVFDATRPVPW